MGYAQAVQDVAVQRDEERAAFIDSHGIASDSVQEIVPDASVRHFFRVTHQGRSAILMDARPPLEDTEKYVLMRKKFDAIGLTVPEIYAADHDHGFVLMEDFGDVRLFERLERGEDRAPLYTLAVDALIQKAKANPDVALEGSVAYSDEYWLFRIEQFLLHYMPEVLGQTPTQAQRDDLLGAFHDALTAAHALDDVLLHGDYGAQNLYFLPDRAGVKALGLIDFQDMTDARGNMMGSPAFDLAFLLQDVRLVVPDALETEMRERFVRGAGIHDQAAFDSEYAVICAAQAVKCLGLFARLGYKDGRDFYKQFIPNCWRNLSRNIDNPALSGVKTWFDQNKIDINYG